MSTHDKIIAAVFGVVMIAAMFETWWRFVRRIGKDD